MKKIIFNVAELAKYLKVSAMTIYRYAQKGKIPGFKIGSDWRFHKNSIDRWIKEKEYWYATKKERRKPELFEQSGNSFV